MKQTALVIVVGLIALEASGQSMAEAARREKERQEKARQQGGSAKVVTQDELQASKGQVANDPSIAPAAPTSDPASGRTSRTVGVPGAGSSSAARTTAPASGGSSAAPPRGGDEATWKSGINGIRANIARLEKEVAELDAKANRLAYGTATSRGGSSKIRDLNGNPVFRETPGQKAAREGSNAAAQQSWEKERADVLDKLERAKSALTKARKDLEVYEESARRQGIPPGWLR
jgi:hypothetical protein